MSSNNISPTKLWLLAQKNAALAEMPAQPSLPRPQGLTRTKTPYYGNPVAAASLDWDSDLDDSDVEVKKIEATRAVYRSGGILRGLPREDKVKDGVFDNAIDGGTPVRYHQRRRTQPPPTNQAMASNDGRSLRPSNMFNQNPGPPPTWSLPPTPPRPSPAPRPLPPTPVRTADTSRDGARTPTARSFMDADELSDGEVEEDWEAILDNYGMGITEAERKAELAPKAKARTSGNMEWSGSRHGWVQARDHGDEGSEAGSDTGSADTTKLGYGDAKFRALLNSSATEFKLNEAVKGKHISFAGSTSTPGDKEAKKEKRASRNLTDVFKGLQLGRMGSIKGRGKRDSVEPSRSSPSREGPGQMTILRGDYRSSMGEESDTSSISSIESNSTLIKEKGKRVSVGDGSNPFSDEGKSQFSIVPNNNRFSVGGGSKRVSAGEESNRFSMGGAGKRFSIGNGGKRVSMGEASTRVSRGEDSNPFSDEGSSQFSIVRGSNRYSMGDSKKGVSKGQDSSRLSVGEGGNQSSISRGSKRVSEGEESKRVSMGEGSNRAFDGDGRNRSLMVEASKRLAAAERSYQNSKGEENKRVAAGEESKRELVGEGSKRYSMRERKKPAK